MAMYLHAPAPAESGSYRTTNLFGPMHTLFDRAEDKNLEQELRIRLDEPHNHIQPIFGGPGPRVYRKSRCARTKLVASPSRIHACQC